MHKGVYLRGRIYWLRYSVAGKQKFKSLKTDNLISALAQARDERERPSVPGERWAVEVAAYIKGAAESGKLSAGFAANRKGVLLAEGLRMKWHRADQLTGEAIQGWFDTLKRLKCDSTALTYLTHIRSFLGWLVDAGKLRGNPCDGINLRRTKYTLRTNIASPDDARKLIDAATGALRTALMLGLLCGLRRREIMHARWDWIEGGSIRVKPGHGFRPKWGRERIVPIPAQLRENLAQKPTGAEYLVGLGKRPYDFKRPWLDHLTACNVVGITIHDMRRTFASLKVTAGVPLYKVAKWMGISVAVAERCYAHLAPDTSGDVERGLP